MKLRLFSEVDSQAIHRAALSGSEEMQKRVRERLMDLLSSS